MSAKQLVFITTLIFTCVVNLTSQVTSLEVLIQDSYTDKALESVLVSVLLNGVVIDSAYTDINGMAYIHFVTNVRESDGLPSSISLSHNYPNPFRDETNIELGIPVAQTLTATVYNILGQRVAYQQLPVSGGYHTLKLSLGHLPSGVYFLRVDGNEKQAIKLLKMGGDVYPSGPLFSISSGTPFGRAAAGKVAEGEYLLRAKKDRYALYEAFLSTSEIREITIKLERNNLVEFVVVDAANNEVAEQLKIKMLNYEETITTPQTLTLKSGNYRVTGSVSIDHSIEIPSVDTTLVFSLELSKSKIINAQQGGSISTDDGILLDIPPDALLEDTQITVTPIVGTRMHEWCIKGVHLKPDGLTLQKAARLKLPLPSNWPVDHHPLVFISFESDPARYFDTGISAGIIQSGNNIFAETDIMHFSQYGVVKNCHKGTLSFLLESFGQRGCGDDAAWEKVKIKYPATNTDIITNPQTGHNTLQAFLGTYFKDIGGLNKDVLTNQKWNEIMNYINSEDKRVIILFTKDQWGEKDSDGFFRSVSHSAAMEIKDGRLKLRNSASVHDEILEHIPNNVFWYPYEEDKELTAEEFDNFREMKSFEAIEKLLTDKPELFEHLTPRETRPIPWNAVRFFVANDPDNKNPCIDSEDGTITDIDGNIYKIIKIGDQWWMAENLRVTRYRNGSFIPTGLNDSTWRNTTDGAYAIYPHTLVDDIDSDAGMLTAYGALYNWYAVNDSRGLCPIGWHVPTDSEWKKLEMYLGMSQEEADKIGRRGSDEGGKMKSILTEPDAHPRWNSPNTGATNESGFSGLPAGYRTGGGYFDYVGRFGFWWSSTESSTYFVWQRALVYNYRDVSRTNELRRFGFSVRCIK